MADRSVSPVGTSTQSTGGPASRTGGTKQVSITAVPAAPQAKTGFGGGGGNTDNASSLKRDRGPSRTSSNKDWTTLKKQPEGGGCRKGDSSSSASSPFLPVTLQELASAQTRGEDIGPLGTQLLSDAKAAGTASTTVIGSA